MQNIKYTCLLGKNAMCSPTERCRICGFEAAESAQEEKEKLLARLKELEDKPCE